MSLPNSPTLEVDLSAIRANYRLLKQRFTGQSLSAVVKADAYGLGVAAVSRALLEEGCKMFFVATLSEGIELRGHLPDVPIAVFNGLHEKEEKEYQEYQLIPVVNDPAQLDRFLTHIPRTDDSWLGILHVDTGMTRLGLSFSELDGIAPAKLALAAEYLPLLMSHLACANDAVHPKNTEQLKRFNAARELLPGVQASLCNSSGIFLGPEFHFQMGRPGCALYGITPVSGQNPMQPVATLSAPILQIRTLDRDETIGYGATASAKKGSRIAITAMGYSDGYFRSLTGKGFAFVAGQKVPLIGRVSMDMVALDVSTIPESKLSAPSRAEFINKEQTVDDIAAACGTIGYEIFTRIGRRVQRVYI